MELTEQQESGGWTLRLDGGIIAWARSREWLTERRPHVEALMQDAKKCRRVFVYGTLKKGYALNASLTRYGAVLIAENVKLEHMTLLRHQYGGFPMMVPSGVPSFVLGEVWEVPEGSRAVTMLNELDHAEGVDAGMYSREYVETSEGPAWCYVWRLSTEDLMPIGPSWPPPPSARPTGTYAEVNMRP